MKKSDVVKIGAVVAMVGLAFFFFWWRRASVGAEVGEYAPDFILPALSTAPSVPPAVHLYEHRGHVVLVNFWATWCPPCIEETPSLEKLSIAASKLGVEVISVSVDQDPEAIKKFVSAYHLSFPVTRDPNQIVASQYGTFKFPETYILDRDGRVAEKIVGATDWQNPLMISFLESLARPGRRPNKPAPQ